MSTHTNHNNIEKDLQDLFKPRSEEIETKHDSLMLMAAFLSEIELAQEQQDVSRGELASKIKTSASYLTQVFRHRKPLNFLTLAKMKRALNLRFEIRAFYKLDFPDQRTGQEFKPILMKEFAQNSLLNQTYDEVPTTGSKFSTTSESFVVSSSIGRDIKLDSMWT